MKLISCKKCNSDCRVREMKRTNNKGITELYKLIYHQDGTKEKRVWATLKGQEILSVKLI